MDHTFTQDQDFDPVGTQLVNNLIRGALTSGRPMESSIFDPPDPPVPPDADNEPVSLALNTKICIIHDAGKCTISD